MMTRDRVGEYGFRRQEKDPNQPEKKEEIITMNGELDFQVSCCPSLSICNESSTIVARTRKQDNLYYERPEDIEGRLFAFIKVNKAKIKL